MENDCVIALDSEQPVIEGTMMNRTETQAVLGFVRPALVLNGDDRCLRRLHSNRMPEWNSRQP
jgi:hypothetical protein